MTLAKLAELDALAGKATPGPWTVFHGLYNDGVDAPGGHTVIPFEDEEMDAAGVDTRETAAYIAACSPERIRAMIAVIQATYSTDVPGGINKFIDARAALEALP